MSIHEAVRSGNARAFVDMTRNQQSRALAVLTTEVYRSLTMIRVPHCKGTTTSCDGTQPCWIAGSVPLARLQLVLHETHPKLFDTVIDVESCSFETFLTAIVKFNLFVYSETDFLEFPVLRSRYNKHEWRCAPHAKSVAMKMDKLIAERFDNLNAEQLKHDLSALVLDIFRNLTTPPSSQNNLGHSGGVDPFLSAGSASVVQLQRVVRERLATLYHSVVECAFGGAFETFLTAAVHLQLFFYDEADFVKFPVLRLYHNNERRCAPHAKSVALVKDKLTAELLENQNLDRSKSELSALVLDIFRNLTTPPSSQNNLGHSGGVDPFLSAGSASVVQLQRVVRERLATLYHSVVECAFGGAFETFLTAAVHLQLFFYDEADFVKFPVLRLYHNNERRCAPHAKSVALVKDKLTAELLENQNLDRSKSELSALVLDYFRSLTMTRLQTKQQQSLPVGSAAAVRLQCMVREKHTALYQDVVTSSCGGNFQTFLSEVVHLHLFFYDQADFVKFPVLRLLHNEHEGRCALQDKLVTVQQDVEIAKRWEMLVLEDLPPMAMRAARALHATNPLAVLPADGEQRARVWYSHQAINDFVETAEEELQLLTIVSKTRVAVALREALRNAGRIILEEVKMSKILSHDTSPDTANAETGFLQESGESSPSSTFVLVKTSTSSADG